MNLEQVFALFARIAKKRWTFLGAFLLAFCVSLSLLWTLGLVPSSFLTTYGTTVVPVTPVETDTGFKPLFADGEGEMPIGIEIPSVGVKANVINPDSVDIQVLDEALLSGAVRYPASGKLGEAGNVLIFGHSSHLPVVHNQSFKAFNEIATLKAGDPIYVSSEGRRYVYVVEKVEPADIENGAIPLVVEGSVLTLVTCNSFGDKSDRFVVTASLATID